MNEETKLCGNVGDVPGGTATCISPAGHPPLTGEGGAQWAHGDDGQMWGDVVPPQWLPETHGAEGVAMCGSLFAGSLVRCDRSTDHPPLWLDGVRWDHGYAMEDAFRRTRWNAESVPPPPVPQPMQNAAVCGHMDGAGGGFWACVEPTGHEGPHDYHRVDQPPAPDRTLCLDTYTDMTGKQHVCSLGAGHSGYMHHDAGTGTGWNHTTAPEQMPMEEAVRRAGLDPQRVKVITGAEVLKLLTEGCGECDECRAARAKASTAPEPAEPQMSARMRLVPLPDLPSGVRQGFALIVDCVGGPADADVQRQVWEEFGDEIGAQTTLVYPGALYVDTSDVS